MDAGSIRVRVLALILLTEGTLGVSDNFRLGEGSRCMHESTCLQAYELGFGCGCGRL
jgi:hypothetical protein